MDNDNVKIKGFVSYAIHMKSDGLELLQWKMGNIAVDNQNFFVLQDKNGNEIMKKPINELDCKSDMTVSAGGFLIVDGNTEVYITFPKNFLYSPIGYKRWCKALGVSDSTVVKVLTNSLLVARLVSIVILLIGLVFAASLYII